MIWFLLAFLLGVLVGVVAPRLGHRHDWTEWTRWASIHDPSDDCRFERVRRCRVCRKADRDAVGQHPCGIQPCPHRHLFAEVLKDEPEDRMKRLEKELGFDG